MTLGEVASPSHNSLAEVAGKPAIACVTEPNPGEQDIWYARANAAEPDSIADWTATLVLAPGPPGEFLTGLSLFAHEGIPALSFSSTVADQVCFARPDSAAPAGPGDWSVGPVCEAAKGGICTAALEYGGYPAVVYQELGTDYLNFAGADQWSPSMLTNWQGYTVDDESGVTGRMTADRLTDGIVVAYRDANLGTLMCAWFRGDIPHKAGTWFVMKVAEDVSTTGLNVVAAMANGWPAILYGDPDDEELRLATMTPPY